VLRCTAAASPGSGPCLATECGRTSPSLCLPSCAALHCFTLCFPTPHPSALQTLVFKLGLAKSIHHARVLIRQRHIRVGKQIVNVPSFLVRVDSQKHVDFALKSPFGGGRPGRNKRRSLASKGAGGGGDDEEE
jgi:hypothetical protein